ncbi:type I-E CRISPR-associated protein Cas6/Cse3/CasE [Oceanimonas baumannii]|uniref:type I-E CRISPR-associated protein Cas6/Cse3/CasE n=1 Tax=Oceanimonas baumannii TaxID=129578 RepID=UPI001D1881A2|nr:type I-E CRISPR-associated protein Cas6/Cse3/CasE [Oceanimonas baumannii]MCC4263862.1 type I-E CRISPR-associated protein Cas6/Cse3/CasE [Oceanimonas baumannii]
MYLSRVTLADAPSARAELIKSMHKGVYGYHQLLWRLFTQQSERSFLFRHEQSDGRLVPQGEPVFYVLSREQPDNTERLFQVESRPFLPQLKSGDQLGFQLRVNPTVCRNGKRHDVLMDAQQKWLYQEAQLLALSTEGTKKNLKHRLLDMATDEDIQRWNTVIENGRYCDELEARLGRSSALELALKTISEQALLTWWQQRSQQIGIQCSDDAVQADGYLQHHIKGKGTGAMFSSINLSGSLTVDKPEAFIESLARGVGRSKAFGCGLMLIRRV